MSKQIQLSPEVLALYSPVDDPLAKKFSTEFANADQSVIDAFCDHHFHISRACSEAEKLLDNVSGIRLCVNAIGRSAHGESEIAYTLFIDQPNRVMRGEEVGPTFGATMFALANHKLLADKIAEELEE